MTRFESLGPDRADEALEFCRAHPDHTVHHAGWITDGGLAQDPLAARGWMLAERGRSRELLGLCFLSASGIMIPAMDSPSSVEHLYGVARTNPTLLRVLVGPRALLDPLWARLTTLGLGARLSRAQLVYAVERAQFTPAAAPLAIETATERHLEELVTTSAAMAREEAQDDPYARNPTMFRERLRARLLRGRDFVHVEAARVVWKGNVAAMSTVCGGQLEGIYTVPSARRRGLGRAGTSSLTRWVLDRASRASLLVNADNAAARALYEGLGFTQRLEHRTIFVSQG